MRCSCFAPLCLSAFAGNPFNHGVARSLTRSFTGLIIFEPFNSLTFSLCVLAALRAIKICENLRDLREILFNHGPDFSGSRSLTRSFTGLIIFEPFNSLTFSLCVLAALRAIKICEYLRDLREKPFNQGVTLLITPPAFRSGQAFDKNS
jgi:hypothetical protein